MIQKKILIIDDDAAFLDSMGMVLKMEGFDVHDASTAESGFEALVNVSPDLVMLDVNLPDKSGFEVLKAIRKSEVFRSIPVVLITADTAVLVDEAFDKGADDCVFKPMDPKKTIARIKDLIG